MRYSHYQKSHTLATSKKASRTPSSSLSPWVKKHSDPRKKLSKRPNHPLENTKHPQSGPLKKAVYLLIASIGSIGIISSAFWLNDQTSFSNKKELSASIEILPSLTPAQQSSPALSHVKDASRSLLAEDLGTHNYKITNTHAKITNERVTDSTLVATNSYSPYIDGISILGTKVLAPAALQTQADSSHTGVNEVTNFFQPPLVEYGDSLESGITILHEKKYADYLLQKKRISGPDTYDGGSIYDSENYERLSFGEIGELIDEKGNAFTLAATNTLEEEAFPSPLDGSKSDDPLSVQDIFSGRTHIIKAGESLWSLSRHYNVSTDSIITRNRISNVHILQTGKTLTIPYYSGIYHRVKKGETLLALAKHYATSLEKVIPSGGKQDEIAEKETIFMLEAKIPPLERRRLFGNLFLLPVTGVLTSTYGLRLHPIKQKRLFHTGIDLAGEMQSPVKAVMEGKVIKVSKNGNYGNRVVIRHPLGYETTYSHLHTIIVKDKQNVKRNQTIGLLGHTGLSTGPHLHFEVKHHGQFVNPAPFFRTLKTQVSAKRSLRSS